MISEVFVLSSQGDRLLYKDFRGEGHPGLVEDFFRKVTALPPDQAPVFMEACPPGLHFAHVRHGGLYFVATIPSKASPFAALEFLNRLAALLRDSCGALDERSVSLNFALLYELLDELLDYGYVQSTAPEVLRNFLQVEPVLGPRFSLLDLSSVGLWVTNDRGVDQIAARQIVSKGTPLQNAADVATALVEWPLTGKGKSLPAMR
nr:AP-4 complex subunit mu-1-like [Anolis sagrei ordinatus]